MTRRGRLGLFLSTVSLVLWGTGLLLLGAVVAPRVFLDSGLDRPEAGAVMTMVFRSFDRWVLVAMALLILGEFLRLCALRPRRGTLMFNLLLLGLLLGFGVGGSLVVNPRIEAMQMYGLRRGPGPEGLRFERLHRTSERTGRAQLLLCVALLGFCWLTTGPGRQEIEPQERREESAP